MRTAIQLFRKIFMPVLSIIVMLGCDDEPSEQLPCVPFPGNPCHLYKVQKEVVYQSNTYVTTDEFQLDDLKRPKSHTRSLNSEISYTSAFEYNGDGLLSKEVITSFAGVSTRSISYTGSGKVSGITAKNSGMYYEYNDADQMISLREHYSVQMMPTGPPEIITRYTNFTYTDATCTNVKNAATRSGEIQREYEYDNKRSVWSMLSLLLDRAADYSINNVTKEKNHLGEVITYTYEYNAHGYPVKCIRSNESKTIDEVYTFFYTCDQ